MKKTLLIAGALLAMTATLALAEGINMSYSDCGTFGTHGKTSTCLSNAGAAMQLIASFIAPPGIVRFVGVDGFIDVQVANATLDDWWKHGATQCRGGTATSVDLGFLSNVNCVDPWAGQGSGASLWTPGFGGANKARLRFQGSMAYDPVTPVVLDPATEYYCAKVSINNTKSTGTGNCAGCLDGACVVLQSIQLFQGEVTDTSPLITTPAPQSHVTWQNPAGVPGCPGVVPTKSSTWGKLKSLYR